MTSFLVAWLAVAIILLPLDFIWLTTMKGFYQQELGGLLRAEPRLGVATAFYIVLAAALAFFVVLPYRDANWSSVLFAGAFFGFAAYGTYDFTNYATLKEFTARVMMVDLVWGTALCGTAALAGSQLMKTI